jgi:NitT/TauT family transport system permease protein
LFLDFMKPWLVVIQTTPVLAVILIALLWFRTESVPVFVAFLMAFPVVCLNTVEGVRSVDGKLLEMARVFRVGAARRFIGIYLPSLFPFLLSAAAAAFGLCWKVVIAAEVLSLPSFGLGAGMYDAKVRLEMPRMFAWTAAAVLLGFLTDSLLAAAAGWLRRRRTL